MQNNKKILSIIALMMLAFSFIMIVVLAINFRDFAQERELNRAHVIASLVEDGLTAHMVSGTMDKREFFLTNAKESSGALKIWIFRTNKVTELFGKGLSNEIVRDELDKKAIETGKPQKVIDESFFNTKLRITIPYVATINQQPNCLTCHTNVKVGDVLGGISMVFSVDEARNKSIITILKITGITVLFILLFIYMTNKFIKPYTDMLGSIKDSLEKASGGDYSSRINVTKDDQSFEVAKWLNTLLEKLEKTVGAIEENISLFVADRRKEFKDPLEKSQSIVKDIAMIYKFKKTIEQDESKDVIYQRLIKIFKEQLRVSDLSLYEVDIKHNKRVLIYDDTPQKYCEIADINTDKRCRAYRTNSIVISDEFPNICQACISDKEYLCINYPIDENISLVLNIKPDTKEELYRNKKAIGYIKNYLESARPVLQSRVLTDILKKSNMIDGLTGLYNRKYLDIFMDKKVKEYSEFAVAMVDIDYFKKVNDHYGHDVGDKVLCGLSEIFRKVTTKDDMVFRFGGEEFLIFIPNLSQVDEIVYNIKNMFENKKFTANGESFNKTLSIGISYYKQDSDQIWQVIKNADIALYEAKNSGRNQIVYYGNIEKD